MGPLATPSARGKVEAAKKKALSKSTRSSSKGSADDSQSLKGSVPKTIVEPSQGPSSKKADGSSPPLLSTGAKAKRPKTSGGGAAGVGASVKRTTSEMKNDLAPKTMQAGLTGRKLSRDRKTTTTIVTTSPPDQSLENGQGLFVQS